MTSPVSYWYCCLNVRERTVLRQTLEGLVLTLFLGIPLPVWRAFWLVLPDSGEAVQAAFLSIYGLEIVTIGEGEEAYEAVAPREGWLPFWGEVGLYVVTPGAACLDGCTQSSVP